MADDLIAEGRKVLEGVTPRPWGPHGRYAASGVFSRDTERLVAATHGAHSSKNAEEYQFENDANSAFIVWAGNNVEALLDALEKAQAKAALTYDDLYADALADARSDAQDFESDLWREVRKYLTELNLDWRDYADDGILAEDAIQYIRDCMDEETRRAEAAEAKLARMEEAGRRVLAPLDEPCRYDHHGYCQEHFLEADCSVAALRAALAALPAPDLRAALDAEQVARMFHCEYEAAAPMFGYETRQDTRDFDPNTPNGRLMVEVCRRVLAAMGVTE